MCFIPFKFCVVIVIVSKVMGNYICWWVESKDVNDTNRESSSSSICCSESR